MTRRIWIGLAVIAVLAGGAWYYWGKKSVSPTANLITAPVTTGDIEETVLATGTLKPVKLVAVGAQVSGRITAVKVALGDKVKAGDLIAEIDSVTQQNALRTAEASLANVKAQRGEKQATLILNQATLARQKNMVAQKAVSQADYETALADVNVTRAQIEALEAQIIEAQVSVETAKANLGYTKITAPIDGTVLSLVSQQGQTVNAVQSAPTIAILGQLDSMIVRTEISEADIVKVAPGQPVYFTVLGDPERRYEATLTSVEPAPESIRSDSSFASSSSASASSSSSSSSSSSAAIYYNGIFNIPNAEGRLRTYMTAQVHIVLGQAKGVKMVPSAALGARDEAGKFAVRVVSVQGQIADRKVDVGLNNKIMAEVKSGLEAGERVVLGLGTGASAPASPGGGRRSPMGF